MGSVGAAWPGVTSGVKDARVIVAGGPRCGKTTLASRLTSGRPDVRVRHTDDLIPLGWSQASEAASLWLDEAGPWLVEGTAVPRALRKWLARHPEGRPCDYAVWLSTPLVVLTAGQRSMLVGCQTVWNEVLPELLRRGVEVKEL